MYSARAVSTITLLGVCHFKTESESSRQSTRRTSPKTAKNTCNEYSVNTRAYYIQFSVFYTIKRSYRPLSFSFLMIRYTHHRKLQPINKDKDIMYCTKYTMTMRSIVLSIFSRSFSQSFASTSEALFFPAPLPQAHSVSITFGT